MGMTITTWRFIIGTPVREIPPQIRPKNITNNDYSDHNRLFINAAGEVVWESFGRGFIYYWDNPK